MSSSDSSDTHPLIDTPITSEKEDVLGRAKIAHNFAQTIRDADANQGLTVGVLGVWGHGKTSLINLMRGQFELDPKLTVIDFNPWMFSGSEQLVSIFFGQFGAELKVRNEKRFQKIIDKIAEYSSILKPVSHFIPLPYAVASAEVAENAINGLSATTSADRSVMELRKEITERLRELDTPIVVIIDDIDRLTTAEIREIFKLVRLTANFPNVIYLLAFDRLRVEAALTEDGIPGRAYLEKIMQLSFDVPQVSTTLGFSHQVRHSGS